MRVLAVLLLCAASSFAQMPEPPLPWDAPTRAELLRLFDVLEVGQQMESMRAVMRNMVQQQFANIPDNSLTPRQKQELGSLQGELQDQFLGGSFMQEILEQMVPIYQRHFTSADVQALMAFYSTPVGKKFLHESPKLMAEFMPKVMAGMQTRVKTAMDAVHFDERMKAIMNERKN